MRKQLHRANGKTNIREPALSVPGPRPLFGRYGGTFAFLLDPIGYLNKVFDKYGQIVGVKTASMATPPRKDYPGTVYLYGSRLIQQVSTDHDGYHRVAMSHRLYPVGNVSERQKPLKRIMTGLPHHRGDKHRQQRRLLLPAFQRQTAQTYYDDMVAVTNEFLSNWQTGTVYDMRREMLRLTLFISARTLFGQVSADEGERIGYLVDDWIRFIMSVSHLLPYDLPGIPYRRWLNLSHEIDKSTRQIIANKRASEADDGSLLSMLIHARDEDGSKLSEDELIGHISLLMWGSRDASANALVWTLFLLSQHPRILADVIDELEAEVGGQVVSINQLDRLPLLDRIIKESLRLLPPFPVIHRVATENTELAGYFLPAGTELIMSIYHTHRRSELYTHAAIFDPDRWLTIEPEVFEYMPFGGGPRMCIGTSFADVELKIVLTLLLQRYRLQVVSGTKIDRQVDVSMTPKYGMPMIVHPQDRAFHRSPGQVRGNIFEMVDLSK